MKIYNLLNLFATSHGKGPVYGMGGMAKRVVTREVMSGRASVETSQAFATVTTDKYKETKIQHIDKEEIKATELKLKKQFIGLIRSHTDNKFIEYILIKKNICYLYKKHASALAILNRFMKKKTARKR